MASRTRCLLVALLALTCSSPEVWAGKVGSQFPVNTTPGAPARPNVAALSNGNFVVTWHNHVGNLIVYGQLYAAAGTLIGGEFQVSTNTEQDQYRPSVAALGGGGFVVAWTSSKNAPQTANVWVRLYDAGGTPEGSPFLVNTHRKNDQQLPSVAALSSGGFVVAWTSYGQGRNLYGRYGQRYGAAGAPIGGEFRIDTTPPDGFGVRHDEPGPKVAAFSDGGFVVAWDNPGPESSR